jgi:ribonucleoside-diphosphate reductase alpha chain
MPLEIKSRFAGEGGAWTDGIETVLTDAVIRDADGKEIFKKRIETIKGWSDTANAIVASKYMLPHEMSVIQMVNRVASAITNWGIQDGYFDQENGSRFHQELGYILIHQMASFNSPVWFNVGRTEHPTTAACFINSVGDTMEDILEWYRTEGLIFRDGSGAGVNISSLRSSKEFLSNGGKPSGPISFMKAADASAGVIKSGGKVRRAAKMVILDDIHPDILEFIQCKVKEEKKAQVLIDAGFDGSIGGDALSTVAFQNSNHAVSLGDVFMENYREGEWYATFHVKDPSQPMEQLDARTVMTEIAKAVHYCGDPGVIFRDTVNRWNPIPRTGPIRACNPCAEYFNVDDSACNLASIRLTAFINPEGEFDYSMFSKVVEIMIISQDILIDRSSYPTEKIKDNSVKLRALGLGFTDLGALLMSMGIPYDSDEGRDIAAGIASTMTAMAFRTSAVLAKARGPFVGWDQNRDAVLEVLQRHQRRAPDLPLYAGTQTVWEQTRLLAQEFGVRNCMTTLLAPTGTISFMMDCTTTGIEPELSLIKYKTMVGGGHIKIVNEKVECALSALGYLEPEIKRILKYVEEVGCLEDSADLSSQHISVFDCALKPELGGRCLTPMSHLMMMAAVQPFISGAISKTVNLPTETTVAEIEDLITESHALGLKAVTFYRDGCKDSQPLSVAKTIKLVVDVKSPPRRKLPKDCKAIRHKFAVNGIDGYIHAGLDEEGSVGEVFVTISKAGSTISGLVDTVAILTSFALQYGVPLRDLVRKLSHVRFEPSGFTGNPDIPMAKSLVDYIFRWLGHTFLESEDQDAAGLVEGKREAHNDAPVCPACGDLMVRSGHCYCCRNCGETSGCS